MTSATGSFDRRARKNAHYHFVSSLSSIVSVPLAIMSFALCGTVGAFAASTCTANAVSSVLLPVRRLLAGMVTRHGGYDRDAVDGNSWALEPCAYFHERPACTERMRVGSSSHLRRALARGRRFTTTGEGDFDRLSIEFVAMAKQRCRFASSVIDCCCSAAAARRSSVLGWLPRAMEGPAEQCRFLRALSVHLGAFLLLRMTH